MENRFKSVWESIEDLKTQPRQAREIRTMEFDEFEEKVLSQDPKFVESMVESLYAGDGYILKRAFPSEYLKALTLRTHEYGKRSPSSFYKMLQDCPDFHRVIDRETAKKYSFTAIKHAYYFFPWNDDPLNLFPTINERWRIFKFLGGFQLDEYEKNKPLDGVIDRIQIVQYPAGAGLLEPHSDPYVNQRVVIGAMMSRRGVDYETGGFYLVGKEDEKINLEDQLDIGDMVSGYPTVVHGVDLVDGHKALDWTSIQGRWFLGLYSNDSDHVKDKLRGHSVQLEAQ